MILLLIIQGNTLVDVLLMVFYEFQIFIFYIFFPFLYLMCAKFQNE